MLGWLRRHRLAKHLAKLGFTNAPAQPAVIENELKALQAQGDAKAADEGAAEAVGGLPEAPLPAEGHRRLSAPRAAAR